MPGGTTLNAIYAALGALVASATGRVWWDKRGIQAQPNGPYATVYITVGDGLQNQVVENVLLETPGIGGEIYGQVVWGTCLINIQVEDDCPVCSHWVPNVEGTTPL